MYRHFTPNNRQFHKNPEEGTITKDGERIRTIFKIEDKRVDSFLIELESLYKKYDLCITDICEYDWISVNKLTDGDLDETINLTLDIEYEDNEIEFILEDVAESYTGEKDYRYKGNK